MIYYYNTFLNLRRIKLLAAPRSNWFLFSEIFKFIVKSQLSKILKAKINFAKNDQNDKFEFDVFELEIFSVQGQVQLSSSRSSCGRYRSG